MQQVSTGVFADDEVEARILGVIREAEEYLYLVSPYNKFWVHLKDAIRATRQRGDQSNST